MSLNRNSAAEFSPLKVRYSAKVVCEAINPSVSASCFCKGISCSSELAPDVRLSFLSVQATPLSLGSSPGFRQLSLRQQRIYAPGEFRNL